MARGWLSQGRTGRPLKASWESLVLAWRRRDSSREPPRLTWPLRSPSRPPLSAFSVTPLPWGSAELTHQPQRGAASSQGLVGIGGSVS